ncbi:hypothetical protein [Hahella sp. KA22]|uniref:hypothetical protein n=1 Tax=unclassified Hahella TaxID=2624107 RepID=UPI000FDE7456|nr:hypothetical protein [Hahella sp. KA22]AZZ91047.1 hypothetical protein ENC22_07500 [Hahella sp. KA22]QAY54417.1 hypothetical protein EUZ85_10055 [Hahella sp. KA22]
MSQTFTDVEVEKTLAESEALIRKAENMREQGDKLFQSLGIPRGSAQKILNHPLASEGFKQQGMEQLQEWRDEITEIMKTGSRTTTPIKRKKSNRNYLAI